MSLLAAGDHRADRQSLLAGALIATLTIAVFSSVTSHGFLTYDDLDYITDNPLVRRGLTSDGVVAAFTTFQAVNWSPVTTISHMLDVSLFGMDAGLHHLASVALHSCAALALCMTWRALSGSLLQAVVVASVFAIHPLRVESVVWASERKDVLCALFSILTIGAHARLARARRGPPFVRAWLLMILLGGLALLSKPMAVTLPCVLLLFDVWPLRRCDRSSSWRACALLLLEKAPLFVTAVGVSMATVAAQRGAIHSTTLLPITLRLQNAVVAVFTYLRQFVWPADLVVLTPLPPAGPSSASVISAVVVVVAITCVALWSRRPAVIVGWLFFIGTVVPVSGLVQVGLQASADRYTYIPSIGLAIIVADLADVVGSRSRRAMLVVVTMGATLLLASALITMEQVDVWRSESSLFAHAVERTGPNPTARALLADALLREHRADEAREHAAAAVQLQPIADHIDLLGRAQLAGGATAEAIRLLSPLCAQEPPHAAGCVHLGEAALAAGDIAMAQAAAERASTAAPTLAEVKLLVAETGLASPSPDPAGALRAAQSAVRQLGDRADARALTILAEALAATNQRERSLQMIDGALEVAVAERDDVSMRRLKALRARL